MYARGYYTLSSNIFTQALIPITCMVFFFLNDTAPTEIYPLSLHDPLPISPDRSLAASALAGLSADSEQRAVSRREKARAQDVSVERLTAAARTLLEEEIAAAHGREVSFEVDRKSTRLNSSH